MGPGCGHLRQLLNSLMQTRFLRRTQNGEYARVAAGHESTPTARPGQRGQSLGRFPSRSLAPVVLEYKRTRAASASFGSGGFDLVLCVPQVEKASRLVYWEGASTGHEDNVPMLIDGSGGALFLMVAPGGAAPGMITETPSCGDRHPRTGPTGPERSVSRIRRAEAATIGPQRHRRDDDSRIVLQRLIKAGEFRSAAEQATPAQNIGQAPTDTTTRSTRVSNPRRDARANAPNARPRSRSATS